MSLSELQLKGGTEGKVWKEEEEDSGTYLQLEPCVNIHGPGIVTLLQHASPLGPASHSSFSSIL